MNQIKSQLIIRSN